MPSIQKVLSTTDSNFRCYSHEDLNPVARILNSRIQGNENRVYGNDIIPINRGMKKSSLDQATSQKVAKLLRQYYALRTQFNDQEIPVCSY
jgi:hypothetical protein